MTTTINAAALQDLISTTLAVGPLEAFLKQAIGKIVMNGYTLTALTGSAGSLTGDYDDDEASGILEVALAQYTAYQTAGTQSYSQSVGGVSQSVSASTAARAVDDTAKKVADALKLKNNSPPIYIAKAALEN